MVIQCVRAVPVHPALAADRDAAQQQQQGQAQRDDKSDNASELTTTMGPALNGSYAVRNNPKQVDVSYFLMILYWSF